jgi:GDP-L-fucose synthase
MVGSALMRALARAGATDLIGTGSADLDLREQSAVRAFLQRERPAVVYLAAARVGGIQANSSRPATFIADNLQIATNVICAAREAGVSRLLFLGSSCVYPREAPQPIREEALLTGPLEPTNEPYAIAKIAGLKLCQAFNAEYGTDFRSVMPTNLYGPGDNYDLEGSHVLPALIRKCHDAKVSGAAAVEVWGSGTPRREFLHVDDMAEACLRVMALSRAEYAAVTGPGVAHLNVGTGTDLSIRETAELVAEVVGYGGRLEFNASYPDGTPRKRLDVSRLAGLGWRPRIGLREGLEATYRAYRAERDAGGAR